MTTLLDLIEYLYGITLLASGLMLIGMALLS